MAIEGVYLPRRIALSMPIVAAQIEIRRLRLSGQVLFLIDTGSFSTSLHTWDAANLGVNYGDLVESSLTPVHGIGGQAGYYKEPAMLMFLESDGTPLFFELDIHIAEKTTAPAMQNLPSLLGRDFLNRCAVHLDSALNLVQLEPRNVSGGFIQEPPVV